MVIQQQTYEINIEERTLILMNEANLSEMKTSANQLVLPYRNNKKSLFQYLDTLEKSDRFSSIVLFAKNVEQLYEDLKSLLIWVPAAGGVIENKEGKILMIFRRGYWDLPKGKINAKETAKAAALRECFEETGLKNLVLNKKIIETYHIYREKNNLRALKRTKWYYMNYPDNETPVPQMEEDIELAEWLMCEDALRKRPVYRNILEVLIQFNKKNKTK